MGLIVVGLFISGRRIALFEEDFVRAQRLFRAFGVCDISDESSLRDSPFTNINYGTASMYSGKLPATAS
jgi:hypothetical protein